MDYVSVRSQTKGPGEHFAGRRAGADGTVRVPREEAERLAAADPDLELEPHPSAGSSEESGPRRRARPKLNDGKAPAEAHDDGVG